MEIEKNPKVLFDGWPSVREPLSPAALSLHAILAALPSDVQSILALPEPPPGWLGMIETVVHPTPDRPYDRLRWEQLFLPKLAVRLDASLLHLTSSIAPLSTRTPAVVSWNGYSESLYGDHPLPPTGETERVTAHSSSVWARLRLSLGRGGLPRARAILIPNDTPLPQGFSSPGGAGQVHALSPIVHPDFTPLDHPDLSTEGKSLGLGPTAGNGSQHVQRLGELSERTSLEELRDLDVPETFVLYHGPSGRAALHHLLQAWNWAAGPIGDYYPLLLVGLGDGERSIFHEIADKADLGDTVRALPPLSPPALARLVQTCSAVFHPAPASPWSGSVRHALACGKPLVAAETPLTSAMVGAAAYLIPRGDPRALGAAIISVIVEEQLAKQLSDAAARRAAAWDRAAFGIQLVSLYEEILAFPLKY